MVSMSHVHRVGFRNYSVDYLGEPKDGFAFSDYWDFENVVMWRFPIVQRRKLLWIKLRNKCTGREMFITDWHRVASVRQSLFQNIRGGKDTQKYGISGRRGYR